MVCTSSRGRQRSWLTWFIRNGWHHVSQLRHTKHSRGLGDGSHSCDLGLSTHILHRENGLHTVETREELGLGRHHFRDIIGRFQKYAIGGWNIDTYCRCFWFSRFQCLVSVCNGYLLANSFSNRPLILPFPLVLPQPPSPTQRNEKSET